MKLASFSRNGEQGFGAVVGDRLLDLTQAFGAQAPGLRQVLERDLLHAVRAQIDAGGLPERELDAVTFEPVIPDPGKIICVGLNYADHVQETGRQVTAHPTLFLRVPESQTGHGQPMLLPPESDALDFEGEIALIIGKGGRRVAEAEAMNHVAGYSCYNDGSIRDWQAAATQWTAGKNFAATGAFGPWMVTADAIPTDRPMRLITRLNGTMVQETTTDLLIHGFARLIAHISVFTTLYPGDVIVTGTPAGVGFKRSPPLFMKDGDEVEVEVDAIGTLRNRVTAE
ncbi:MAG: 2-keto-4-pentenoate hydratase/2-oxohepta-3-ene-1,7-dioic acid hydratase (catechol pathway) [Rhodobacteraceae bacterium HLUCCA12]|nr:MAG: 2-keto-4-pentenoate hydratase/2-oxohepta-3-ene-1,7-dioic acid hydratase (catechol pathway) [Rhodobacteraceae bacterium HLUCCA12]